MVLSIKPTMSRVTAELQITETMLVLPLVVYKKTVRIDCLHSKKELALD